MGATTACITYASSHLWQNWHQGKSTLVLEFVEHSLNLLFRLLSPERKVSGLDVCRAQSGNIQLSFGCFSATRTTCSNRCDRSLVTLLRTAATSSFLWLRQCYLHHMQQQVTEITCNSTAEK